jgi:hypothetical protein
MGIKGALLISKVSSSFSLAQRREFRATLRPTGHVWVWLAHRKSPNAFGIHEVGAHAYAFRGGSFLNPGSGLRYITVTLSIRSLTFQILCSRTGDRPPVDARWDDATILLWPNVGRDVTWPPAETLNDQGFDQLLKRWLAQSLARKQKHSLTPTPRVRSFRGD